MLASPAHGRTLGINLGSGARDDTGAEFPALAGTRFPAWRLETSGVYAEELFAAPFVIVSHDTQADPVLNYGNRAALTLWEMSWEELTRTPSRLTVEPVARCDGLRDLGAHQISVALAQAIHRDGDRAGFEAEVGGGAVVAFLGGVAEELAQSRELRRLDHSDLLLLQSLQRAVQHGERPLPVEG